MRSFKRIAAIVIIRFHARSGGSAKHRFRRFKVSVWATHLFDEKRGWATAPDAIYRCWRFGTEYLHTTATANAGDFPPLGRADAIVQFCTVLDPGVPNREWCLQFWSAAISGAFRTRASVYHVPPTFRASVGLGTAFLVKLGSPATFVVRDWSVAVGVAVFSSQVYLVLEVNPV